MEQLDLFNQNHYLYDKMDKIERSMDKRTRAIFSLLGEMENQIIQMKEQYSHLLTDTTNQKRIS